MVQILRIIYACMHACMHAVVHVFVVHSAGFITTFCPCFTFGQVSEILNEGQTRKCLFIYVSVAPSHFMHYDLSSISFMMYLTNVSIKQLRDV